METSHHNLDQLFSQLGLPAGQAEIDAFIASHRPLAGDVALHDAPFWTEGQKDFLREEILEDADWAPSIDALNALLRA